MIKDLLPAYYESYENDPVYTALRTIVIDGHEVVWMEFTGVTGEGDKRRTYTGRALYCECDFTKGVGWDVKDGKHYRLLDAEKCLKKQTAVHLRHLELRKEYLDKFGGDLYFVHQHIPEIVADLINKAKAGEFLEGSAGASFWGGYFYLQTLAEILDLSMKIIWEEANLLVNNKQISLEGAVVQPYYEFPPPSWQECFQIENGGWIGKALLPAHSKMKQVWKLEVIKPDGKPALKYSSVLALSYAPTFGPDVSDVENAKRRLKELVLKAINESKK